MSENTSQRIASYPGRLEARGDERDVLVARDSELSDHDPILSPVTEHIERHGLELADSVTAPDERMVSGTKRVDWFMTPEARREGKLAAPGVLQAMLDRAEHALNVVAPQLVARGDNRQVCVYRSALSSDADPAWQRVMAHTRKYGLQLQSDEEVPAVDGTVNRVLLFVHPKGRMLLNDFVAGRG